MWIFFLSLLLLLSAQQQHNCCGVVTAYYLLHANQLFLKLNASRHCLLWLYGNANMLEMIRCKYVLAMHDNNCAYWLICHPNQDEIWWWATTNFLYYLAFRHRSWSISECIQIHHWSGGVEMTLKVHHQNQYHHMSKYSYICSIDSILGIIFDEISTSSSTYIR